MAPGSVTPAASPSPMSMLATATMAKPANVLGACTSSQPSSAPSSVGGTVGAELVPAGEDVLGRDLLDHLPVVVAGGGDRPLACRWRG